MKLTYSTSLDRDFSGMHFKCDGKCNKSDRSFARRFHVASAISLLSSSLCLVDASHATAGAGLGEGQPRSLGALWVSAGADRASEATPGPGRAATATRPLRSSWRDSLAVGVNGPIPHITVDQFGYLPGSRKVAIIRDPRTGYDAHVSFSPGDRYELLNLNTGEVHASGKLLAWQGGKVDPISGDRLWWFDFSDVATPGDYAVIDVENGIRSPDFRIGDDVYWGVLNHAVKMLYYQRAGIEKTAEFAGRAWADASSHLGPGQDTEARSWLAKGDSSQEKDLRGGWFDAGDYNKYTTWHAENIIVLLRAIDENPGSFGDHSGIPESGNGIPDFLDELKWGLDWLQRMQNSDGSLLSIQKLAEASPPSAAKGRSYYGPPTTSASLMGAAAFAYAAKVYSARPEPNLKKYGRELGASARKAWDWAISNPSVIYYNNDEARQPGSKGLGYGQQELDPQKRAFAKFLAAVHLYELDGDPLFRTYVEENFKSISPKYGPTQWQAKEQDALLYAAGLRGIDPAVRRSIFKRFYDGMRANRHQLPMLRGERFGYRVPMKGYTWGSNKVKLYQARLYHLLLKYAADIEGVAQEDVALAASSAPQYVHYIHGVNPLGLVYLTNMTSIGAEHSVSTIFHRWFAKNTRWSAVTETSPGPPPGFLVGGPNPGFALDACCSVPPSTAAHRCRSRSANEKCRRDYVPPLQQPPMKSFLQFNDGWPANSWEVTEPSVGYQAMYILILAKYARRSEGDVR